MRIIITTAMLCWIFPLLAQNDSLGEELIGDFYQGLVKVEPDTKKCLNDYKLGNCVAIALIKCALAQFGSIENIFEDYEVIENGYAATFSDGQNVSLYDSEIQIVKEISGIRHKVSPKYYQSALILYGLICKKIFIEKQESSRCINSFKNAVEYINAGYPTKIAPQLLGLTGEAPKNKIQSYKAVVIWSRAHAAFASNGIQDIAGKRFFITSGKMRNMRGKGKIRGAFILTK